MLALAVVTLLDLSHSPVSQLMSLDLSLSLVVEELGDMKGKWVISDRVLLALAEA